VGSPSDPVTTDSHLGGMRSGSTRSHAGGSAGRIDPSYVSGCVDGEPCFTVPFSPRAKLLVGGR
jgi:hypothetical protein